MFGKKEASEFDDKARVLMCNIKHGSANHKAAGRLTQLSRRLSNRANYVMRHDLLTGRKPNQSRVDKALKRGLIKQSDQELYTRLPAAVSQRMIQIVGNNWSSFAKAKADWKKNPDKYTGMPRLPGYSKHAKTLYIPCSSFYIRDNKLVFAGALGLMPIPLEKGKFPDQKYNPVASSKIMREVRVVPMGSGYRFELIYDKFQLSVSLLNNTHSVLLNKGAFLSLDLGVGRFASSMTNQAGLAPFLINGGDLLRINQWYNKRCAVLRSLGKYGHLKAVAAKRTRKINDKLHKISRYLVNYCLQHDIGTVIVGKNTGWKQGINIGKRNNQNFVNLPHARFIDMLKYKLREIGINLIEQEESYTSKASYLDNDLMPTYRQGSKNTQTFSGRRVKRGQYRSQDGTLVHADLNGAANIARKAGYEGANLVSGGVVNTPVLIGL